MPPPPEDDFHRALGRALELQRLACEAWAQVQRAQATQPQAAQPQSPPQSPQPQLPQLPPPQSPLPQPQSPQPQSPPPAQLQPPRSRRRQTTPLVHLTPRESQVITLMVTGMPNRSIARQLRISERTVKSHLHSIFSKLGVTTRGEAAACLRGDTVPAAQVPLAPQPARCPVCSAAYRPPDDRLR